MTKRSKNLVWRILPAVAALALIACAGAMKQQRIPTAQVRNPAVVQIVGVTTVKGEEVQFDLGTGFFADGVVNGKVKGAEFHLALAQVERLWVMQKSISKGKTVALVVGVSAAVAVVAGVAVLVAGATKPATSGMGCPFVYSWDGEQYLRDAELYGGAVSRGLERTDYSELPQLRADGGVYRIRVADELEERDFTDSLELWVVDHDRGTRVATDGEGKVYLMADSRAPVAARDETGTDLLPWLAADDHRIWEAPPANSPDDRLRHELELTFAKPPEARTANLLVHGGTSTWGIHMLLTLYELYGREMEARMAVLDRNPAEVQAVRDWSSREDLYTLKVWVEEPSGWQVRGVLQGGAMGARVVPLDVSHVPGDRLRIRLQPPAGFWALNAVAADYSTAKAPERIRIAPWAARSQAGVNVLKELRRSDGVYYEAAKGDSAEVVFHAPAEAPGMQRTLLLASKGYYRPIVSSSTSPDSAALLEIFTMPDGMARFSARRFGERRSGLW